MFPINTLQGSTKFLDPGLPAVVFSCSDVDVMVLSWPTSLLPRLETRIVGGSWDGDKVWDGIIIFLELPKQAASLTPFGVVV